MSLEGAMLGGSFLPEKEFKALMTKVLKENRSSIEASLMATLNYIKSENIKEAYKEWERFQTIILLNPKTDLLAVLNFYDREKQNWIFMNELDVMSTSGKLNTAKVGKKLKTAYGTEILADRLSQLFKTIDNKYANKEEINYAYQVKKRKNIKDFSSKSMRRNSGKTYSKVVYEGMEKVNKRGKVADAFLNHLGKHHASQLANFVRGDGKALEGLKNKDVRAEENLSNKLNFIKLLIDSLNNTAWYTGGDLIVTDQSGRVVANIQLKTSGGLGESIGQINTSGLVSDIEKVFSALEMSDASAAEAFYSMLKTSTATEGLGDKVIQAGYRLAEEAFQRKLT